jgi:hypothetical protein
VVVGVYYARPNSHRALALARERELMMAREAIAMVASGASTRVVVAGIHHGEAILDTARRLGLEAGVRVNPIWRDHGSGADLVVEPIYQ